MADERIQHAVRNTEIIRLPRQHLSTFGTTNLYYYLVTEPAYAEPTKEAKETVIREGRVIAEKPKIVTPYYLWHLEGFSPEARKYFESVIREHGPNAPGLFYTYKNEPGGLNIVSDNWLSVVDKLNRDIDKRGDPLVTIIKGVDDLWDVSLLKFISELTRGSLPDNVDQMRARGLLETDMSGVPAAIRLMIEELFRQVSKGEREPNELKDELDRWGLFDRYEDRFLSLFRRK